MPAKLTLEQCQQTAIERGGKCLSTEYKNNSTKMKWQCKEKHEWEAKYGNIKNNESWCPICLLITLEDCIKTAQERGGKCLSTEYKNTSTKMRWQCEKGHEWKASYHTIKAGHWCPYCAGKAKYTLDDCQQTAIERGGRCLSTEYIIKDTPMLWQCKEGHEWKASYGSIKNSKTWCKICSSKQNGINQRLTLDECQQTAKERCGECLSIEYITNNTKMKWKCKEKHEWEATYHAIKGGHWCPHCVGTARLTLEHCINVAKERGGKCLSTEYKNSKSKILWQCKEGHEWEACYGNKKR